MGVIASFWQFRFCYSRPLPFRPRGFGAVAGRRAHGGCFQVLQLEHALEEREARLRQAEKGKRQAQRRAADRDAARRVWKSSGEALLTLSGVRRRQMCELRTSSSSCPARGRQPRSRYRRGSGARRARRRTRSWRRRRAASRRGASWGAGGSAPSTAASGAGRRSPSSASTGSASPHPTPLQRPPCARWRCSRHDLVGTFGYIDPEYFDSGERTRLVGLAAMISPWQACKLPAPG
jgi:hypothetical protein